MSGHESEWMQRMIANVYVKGFEAAKSMALEAIESTETVECRDSYYAQLGDAMATKVAIREAVQNIKPEEKQ